MWILPKQLSACVPGARDLTSESKEPSEHLVCALAQSLMWRGKHMPPTSWSRVWKKTDWLRRLSTRILPSSTEDRFVGWWTDLLRAGRANLSASQVPVPEQQTLATSGLTSPDSSERSTPPGSSERTSLGICLSEHTMSAESFKRWATGLRLVYSQRKKSGLLTAGSDSSCWPTVTMCGNYNRKGASKTSGGEEETGEEEAEA